MATPEIKVKIGADTAGFDKGMGGVDARLSTFARAAGVAAAGAAIALATGMAALTKASLANIDVLTKQARSLGLTTEAFQKMGLVASEAGIETGKLSAMLGLMQRNISELNDGTQAQVDAFARLGLSISDLQGLAPDAQFEKIAAALDGIADPTTKTALAMDVFGRSGREAINMLSDYGRKAAEAAKFQNDFGIDVSQTAAEDVERANDAVGRLGMVMQGLGNTMAVIVAPGIESTANAFISWAQSVYGAEAALDGLLLNADRARAILGNDVADALLLDKRLITENSEAIADLSYIYSALAGDVNSAVNSMSGDIAFLVEQGFDDLAIQIADVSDEMVELQTKLNSNKISAEEFAAQMTLAIDKAQTLLQEANAIDGVNMATAITQVSLLGKAMEIATGVANRLRNAMPGSAISMELAPSDGSSIGAPFTADPNAPKVKPVRQGVDSFGNFQGAEAAVAGVTSPTSGSGMADLFAQRLEALQEGLATESEVVAEWYLEGQATLEEALANKALTEAEYHDLRERLEEEHQNRLAGIRQIGNQSAISMALGAGEQILNAIGQTNAKALKVAKVFGAAQALISAYQGAAEALKLPFPSNIAAAATVLAKGIGFVNAIKSVNSGGGGGGGGGAGGRSGASQSQAPAQTPLDVRLTGFGPNDLFTGDMIGGLLDRLSTEAGDRGYRIMTA